MPEDVFASLEALATRTGRSRSSVIAELITERLRSEAPEPESPGDVPTPGIARSRRRIAMASRRLDEMGYEWDDNNSAPG